MKSRLAIAMTAFAAVAAWAPLTGARAQEKWDGLVPVSSSQFDQVFLLPGADFSTYTRVMLDPTEVAFQQNWLRDFNRQQSRTGARMSDADADRLLERVQTGFETDFRRAWHAAGYTIAEAPGPQTMRVRTAVVNLSIAAPDNMTAGRSRTFTRDAGRATIIIEARDSKTNALLGRAVDSRVAGGGATMMARNTVTNQADFTRVSRDWATRSVQGFAELKARSPVAETTTAAR